MKANILNFIRTIHLNEQNFIESSFGSKFFGETPMTIQKHAGQVVGLITATVDGKLRKYIFNESNNRMEQNKRKMGLDHGK